MHVVEVILGHQCLLLGSIPIKIRSIGAKMIIRTVGILATGLIIQIVLSVRLLIELVNMHLWKGPDTFLYETYSFAKGIYQHGLVICVS